MKQTRLYAGFPYCGYSSNGIRAEADTLAAAQSLRDELQEFNPVGWNIWDSSTGKLVEGMDHFK